MKNKRLVFMGSTDFSLASLESLYNEGFNVVAVYTREPKPTGRHYKLTKTIVHEFAESHGILVYTPKNFKSDEAIANFKKLQADVVVVAAYGLIIPQALLDLTVFINIHGSLLPRWRGAAPIQRAILAGDTCTGISIMHMDAGLDTGNVISMKSIQITPEMNYGQLSEEMCELGSDMIKEVLLTWDGVTETPQQEEQACYAHKVDKKETKFELTDSAYTIIRKVKAFAPVPGAWFELDGKRIKVLDAALVNDSDETNKEAVFESSDEKWIAKIVQPEGKKTMSGQDFKRGYLKDI